MTLKFTEYILFVFLLMPCALYALDKNGNFESKAEQDRFVAATLKKTAKEINSQAPIMVDSETQLNSVIALNKSMNFNMRLTNLSSKNADANYINKYAWGNLNDTACKSKATRALIDLGVSYVYLYFGNDDRLITRVVVDKYVCN